MVYKNGRTYRIKRRLRKRQLISAQMFDCALCGQPLLRHADGRIEATEDHVFAKVRGGYDGLGNLLAAHKRCNNRKGDRLPTGCEIIWLVAVCARLDVPLRLTTETPWKPELVT